MSTVNHLRIYPTADIHLLWTGNATNTTDPNSIFKIQIQDELSFKAVDHNLLKINYQSAPSGSDAVISWAINASASPANITITAKALGESYLTISYSDPTTPGATHLDILVRVQVHQSLTKAWFGNQTFSFFAPTPGLIAPITTTYYQGKLTVFGLFSDGLICDITDSPFYACSTNSSLIQPVVDPVFGAATFQGTYPAGSIFQGTALGNGQINFVQPTQGSAQVTQYGSPVNFVVRSYPTVGSNKLLQVVDVNGNLQSSRPSNDEITNRNNILFLAEGFSSQSNFLFWVKSVLSQLIVRGADWNFPFSRLLRKSTGTPLNFWVAFESSEIPGITYPRPISLSPKLPVSTGYKCANLGTTLEGVITVDESGVNKTLSSPAALEIAVGLPKAGSPKTAADFQALNPPATLVIDDTNVGIWSNQALTQVGDSVFGCTYGNRLGEQSSFKSFQTTDIQNKPAEYLKHLNRSVAVDYRSSQAGKVNDVSIMPLSVHPPRDIFIADYIASLDFNDGSNSNLGNNIWKSGSKDSNLIITLVNDRFNGGNDVTKKVEGLSIITALVGDSQEFELTSANSDFSNIIRKSDVGVPANGMDTAAEDPTVVLTHELGHAYGLGDEYTDGPQNDTPAAVANCQNLTTLTTVTTVPPGEPQQSNIYISQIPWSSFWRIQASAALTSQATATPSGFISCPVILFEDSRDAWNESQGARVYPMAQGNILNASNHINDFPVLKVEGATRDEILLSCPSGVNAMDLSQLIAGFIFLVPLTDPTTGTILTVIHQSVITDIETYGVFSDVNPLTNKSNNLLPPTPHGIATFQQYVVGLYLRDTSNQDILKSSGWCKMANGSDSVPYCYVCMYVVTSKVVPEFMYQIEDFWNERLGKY